METQSFSTHVRMHPLFHYFTIPLSLVLVLTALFNLISNFSMSAAIAFITTIVLHLALFLVRDYAKKNQDRSIRIELRLRYFQLTGKRLEEMENLFTIGQLVAMRFASDEELVTFIQNPETQKKKPEAIKKEIIQWNADWMRV